jgi:nucleoside triphosphate pyrophosphatase
VPLLSDSAPLVLGSNSPRRREILTNVRVPFVVAAANADEDVGAGESADAYLARVVRAKLDAVRIVLPAELAARCACILVADTTVVLGGEILGKPADVADAERMIARLAGRTHDVKTRFLIAAASGAPLHEETVTTEVTFRPLSSEQARAYAVSGEGLDKAGGYAVQGLGSALVSRVAGSYTNVVGLPACEVVVALVSLGFLL